jgi:uncharacterized protein YcgI (DUF1989 family)
MEEEDILRNFENINIHQKARIDPIDGRMYFTATDSGPGDYIEFFAELDLILAISACPDGGVGTATPLPGEVEVRPLQIEIYDTELSPQTFPTWTDWRPYWRGRWSGEFRDTVKAASAN